MGVRYGLGFFRLGCRELLLRRRRCSWRRYCSVSQSDNPLLKQEGLPKFTEVKAEHVIPGVQKLVGDFIENIKDVEMDLVDPSQKKTWPAIFDALERGGAPLGYGWSVVNHLMGVRNSDELRNAYQQIQPVVIQASTKLSQSVDIYNAIKKLKEINGSLDDAQHRIIDSSLLAARLGGVELTGATKEQFNNNRLKLAQLSTDFSNNVLDSVKSFHILLTDKQDVDGLPLSLRQLMAFSAAEDKANVDPDNGPWKVTLDMPCYEPFMKHSKRRDLRETLYRAFITRASQGNNSNVENIEIIRKLRQENVKILGFENYAAMSLKSKMAKDVDEVMTLIRSLKAKCKEAAQREIDQLRSFARSNGFQGDLAQWDLPYWSERQREHLFNFSEEELRPYFPLDKVLQGLFDLTSFLFGVKIKPADGKAEIWHEDVRFFDILNDNGEHVASFFLDPYSRPAEKRGGAWMDVALGKSKLLGRKPVAYLICNQSPPVKDRPSLMNFREVETLFHEFGHGLQHMLTQVPYADAAGINNIEWDAVELPSQFMENWVYDEVTMATISGHYQTGETLPKHLFEQLVKARKYNAGLQMLRQLYFGALDMELHTNNDHWSDIMKRIAAEYTIIKPLPEDCFPCSFLHIFAGGYSAGYYSYKWAEVMSADAFEAFQEVGLTNREAIAKVGKRFRDTVLAMGGGAHPRTVFQKFRGRDPSPDPLLRLYGLS
ncbi:uncharacterized protein [Ptychodera flava]|uniref:uncharacterized protein isoform X2 n=1 Tax=Ptychodera flava TaxID=63121 RepID=UPI00396AAB60